MVEAMYVNHETTEVMTFESFRGDGTDSVAYSLTVGGKVVERFKRRQNGLLAFIARIDVERD